MNRKKRASLIEGLEFKDLEKLKVIKDEVFKENIEECESQIIDALEVSAEAVNELNSKLIELKEHDLLSISDWLDEYDFNLDILLVDDIIGDKQFREICDLFNLDEDVITVLESVNMPNVNYANDPGKDSGTNSAKDAFAFTLGYYNGDYNPISYIPASQGGDSGGSGSATSTNGILDTETNIWNPTGTEQKELYNGNIAWITTHSEIKHNYIYKVLLI